MTKNIILGKLADIDANEIVLLAGTITLFCFSKKDVGHYILNKMKQEKIVSKYFDAPTIKRKYIKKHNLKFKKFNDEINLFYLVMINNFKTENLKNFYNNIGRLKVGINYKLYLANVDGLYNPKLNKITTIDDKVTCMYHELFHMASSTYKNGVRFSGFKQSYSKKDFYIASGLNEGYTQLLTERYFGHLNDIKGNYLIFVYMAKEIEKIIGQDKMESLYLNSNLPGLIEELKKYTSEKEILDFIYGLDFLFRNFNDDKILVYENVISNTLKNSNLFLLKLYTLKTKKELDSGNIDLDEFNAKLSDYISNTLSVGLNYSSYNKQYMTVLDIEQKLRVILNSPNLSLNVADKGYQKHQ